MNISKFFILATGIIGGLVLFYSAGYLKGKKRAGEFFIYALASIVCAVGAFLARDFVVFLTFWGALLVLLYLMLAVNSEQTAGKALTIVGLGDFCLILGVCFLIVINGGNTSMKGFNPLATDTALKTFTFVLLAVGASAKAGVFGFHNWIIDAAETTPSTTLAFLPGSLDKLLGIYLFIRVTKDFFLPSQGLKMVFMGWGAVTIVLAVMLALMQHDLKKLLGYHAVSQVGYMILGIASGTVLGLAGGIFHMLNNTLYKSALFMTAGNLEHRVRNTDLAKLGGLARFMPVTLVGTTVASFSISGIPPFNGFVSKWMIYQGLLPQVMTPDAIYKILFLIMAMFGSALTLASFVKVIYSVFFGETSESLKGEIKEVSVVMLLPIIVLSVLCVLFGVFAGSMIIKPVLEPVTGYVIVPSGAWASDIASALIIISLALGALIYLLSRVPVRKEQSFIGGEQLKGNSVSGAEFYLTVKEVAPLKKFYMFNDAGGFDFYGHITTVFRYAAYVLFYGVDRLINLMLNGAGKAVFAISLLFKNMHNGLLDRYVAWVILGFAVIMGVLVRCSNFIR